MYIYIYIGTLCPIKKNGMTPLYSNRPSAAAGKKDRSWTDGDGRTDRQVDCQQTPAPLNTAGTQPHGVGIALHTQGKEASRTGDMRKT